jgi:misacylated tRNA(Ala) deacylase
VKKLQATIKSNQKTIQRLSKEAATTLATKLNNEDDPKAFYFLHRNDGVDMDFINTFLKQAKPKKPVFFFITYSDAIDSKSGSLILQGSVEDVDSMSGEITSMLEGKGNGKNGRFQSKVTNLKKIKDCEKFVQKYFENKA